MITFDRRAINVRFEDMKEEFGKWRTALKEIREYTAPTHGFFESETPNDGKKIDHEKIVNGHAMDALDTLAAGMLSGLTSPSRPWFALGCDDPDLALFKPVKEWLSTVQNRMMTVFSNSNIYQVLHSLYLEIGAFGTGAIMVMPDFDTVIRGYNFTIGEYYLGIDHTGRVDSWARQYSKTVVQMVREFGLENCSPAVQSLYNKNQLQQTRIIRHLIEPNDKRIEWRGDFRGMRWRSVQWEEAGRSDQVLRMSGFNDFPIMAPRWQVRASSDTYGRSPGWKALGDVKMLQKMERDGLLALDKVVDPPVQVLGTVEHVNLLPGGINHSSQVAPNAGVRAAYQIQPDFVALQAWVDKVISRIDKAYYADLFMMISSDDRSNVTAQEIIQRHEEKLQVLGPVIEGHESELLDPLIDRVFNIMLDAGLIPPPPIELQGQSLDVQYISVLAQAQKMVGTTSIEQYFRFVGGVASANPDVLDVANFDAGARRYGEDLLIPPELIRSEEEVQRIRKARQAQIDAEKQAQATERMVAGAKTLSETPVGQNSALDAVMAGMGGSGLPPA